MKLNDDDALFIIECYRDGKSVKDIAEDLSLSYHTVYRIVTGKTFKHLHEADPGNIRNLDSDRVVELIKEGFSSTAVGKELGVSAMSVSKVFRENAGESISEFRKRKSVKYGRDVK